MAQTISPWRLGKCQDVSVVAASAVTTDPAGSVHAVLISSTTDCHIRIGMNPVAVVGDTMIRAGWPPLVFGISQGEQVAAIRDSADGTLYVTELTH